MLMPGLKEAFVSEHVKCADLMGLLWPENIFVAVNIPAGVLLLFTATLCDTCALVNSCCTSVSVAVAASLMPLLAISSCSRLQLSSMWRGASAVFKLWCRRAEEKPTTVQDNPKVKKETRVFARKKTKQNNTLRYRHPRASPASEAECRLTCKTGIMLLCRWTQSWHGCSDRTMLCM